MKKIRKKKRRVLRKATDEENFLANLKRFETAITQNYQRAAAIGVIILFAIVFVGVYFYYSHKKRGDAERAVEQALAAGTEDAKATLLKKVVDDYSGTVAGARALYYLGDAYYATGQYDLARTCYEDYLRKHPRAQFAPNAQEGLGYVAESQGKLDEATEHYKKVAERYADSYLAEHAWYNVGRCCEQTGNTAGAVEAYEKQVSLYPASEWTDKTESRLAELRLRLPVARVQQSGEQAPVPSAPAQGSGGTAG